MTATDIADFGADHVVIATGSHWRRDGIGVLNLDPRDFPKALTPDDIFAGATVTGPVVIYDDDHYFMGGALAEKLACDGHAVTLVTPHATASYWTAYTDEQGFVQACLLELGVTLELSHHVTTQMPGEVRLSCAYTGREKATPCETLITVTGRLPDDSLYHALRGQIASLSRVGDCLTPSSIADAVYSGHRFARLLGESDPAPRREFPPHEAAK
jgi:dimethylamine/trimethylamine dehydrogenase